MLPDKNDPRFRELEGGRFTFACHPGVSCFNQCCRQLTLWLTPYDVLRLKKRLGINSGEFIDTYTEIESGQNGWMLPRLAMRTDDPERTCPFLGEGGCTVYEDRPGACRTYPLGRAAKGGIAEGGAREESFFLVTEEHCRGFDEGTDWTPETWTADQGLEDYNRVNDLFLPLITRQPPSLSAADAEKKLRMLFMACYNLDSFRGFVLGGRMMQFFDVPEERIKAMAEDDLELLKFAFDWLLFSIFGEHTLELREEAKKAGFPGA